VVNTGGLIERAAASLRTFRAVMAKPGLGRAVAAYATFNFGEWATWIAILVYAYERGGATESGVVAFVMLVPAAIVAPFAAGVGDRFRRERALLASYVVQAAVMAAAAVALIVNAPSPIVYLLAALTSVSVTLTRPAHGAILPALSMTPAELTSANVASGTVQNISIMIAPAAAGLILNGPGAGAVFAVSALGLALGAALVMGIRTEPTTLAAGEEPRGAGLGDLAEGLSTLLRLPGPRTIVALIGAAAIIEGALDVLIIVLAFDLVGTGEAGVGFLSSAAGLGGVVGAAAAMTLVGRARLAAPFAAGLLLWGLPVGIVGLLPTLAVALGLLVVAGAGRGLLDVAGRTLLQRVTPEQSMGQAFGAVEAAYMGMIAVGSILAPAIIALTGPRQALVMVGLWLPIIVALAWRALRRVDAAAVVHVRELNLLREIPIFAPLSPPTIERLSAKLVPVAVEAGAWVMRQGDLGDRYFIVDRGEIEIFVNDQLVHREGAGDSFGEIALLRNVPRTASVRATTDLDLFALDRDVFLAAVAGHPESRAAAEATATARLAAR
jgi:MFS family permease